MNKSWKLIGMVLLIMASAVSFLPFYLLIIMSSYTTEQIFTGLKLVPGDFFQSNLRLVLSDNFFGAYLNSLIVSVSSTVLGLLICSMAGHALSAYKFKRRNVMYRLILVTMMVPTQISIIGYMIEMRNLHLSNTLFPLILVWTYSGFGAFWMTQYMTGSVSQEIIQSARVDGSGEMRTFFAIVLPMILPALGTLGLLIFLWSWNNYMLPLVMVNKASLYTIPLYISSLGSAYRTDYAARMMGLLLATAPLLLVFILGSKSIVKGLTTGAVKG